MSKGQSPEQRIDAAMKYARLHSYDATVNLLAEGGMYLVFRMIGGDLTYAALSKNPQEDKDTTPEYFKIGRLSSRDLAAMRPVRSS